MTDRPPHSYALARHVLSVAVARGSTSWTRIHGYCWNCPDDQVHAEGTAPDRSLWRVDLADMAATITTLTSNQTAGPTTSAARINLARAELIAALEGADRFAVSDSTADIVLQLAALRGVRYP